MQVFLTLQVSFACAPGFDWGKGCASQDIFLLTCSSPSLLLPPHHNRANPCLGFGGRVGIITPYTSQKSSIQNALRDLYGESALREIEVATVDGFQVRVSLALFLY